MADTMNDTGSVSGLNEPSYDVQVTLSDLQDTDNPLSSAKDFQDLNLLVTSRPPWDLLHTDNHSVRNLSTMACSP